MDIEKQKLIKTALDYVRCGIGSNYSSESFLARMEEIHAPFHELINELVAASDERDALRAELQKAREQKPIYQAGSVGGLWLDVPKETVDSHDVWRTVYELPMPAMPMQDHWAIKSPGMADQFKNEAIAVRVALGFYADSDEVAPVDLTAKIEEISSRGMASRGDLEAFLVQYHSEIWSAASDENGKKSYDDAGKGLAKSFLDNFCSDTKAMPIPKQEPAGAVPIKTEIISKELSHASVYLYSYVESLERLATSPRITEQDAREIVKSYSQYEGRYWWEYEGHSLLNKLNANAVAEVRQEPSGTNRYGLDMSYMVSKLNLLIRDIDSYKGDEAARTLLRLAKVADESVFKESEFSVPSQAAAIPEWLPIDSAPKDGTVIMVCGGSYGCAVDPWPVNDRPFEGVAFVYWCGDSFGTGNDNDYDHYNPEFWMPIPTAQNPNI